MAKSERLLIMDACVLIDICLENPSILGLAGSSLGKVIVLSPIFEEVNQLNDSDIELLNLCKVEPEIETVIEAAQKRGGLSFNDRLCLLFAGNNNGTLYTNDRALLNAALSRGVDVKWGLELLIELTKANQLTNTEALTAAKNICNRSRFPSDQLITEFKRKLKIK